MLEVGGGGVWIEYISPQGLEPRRWPRYHDDLDMGLGMDMEADILMEI